MYTFPLFNSFPAEIHSLILESCPPNDKICLTLTNKYFHSLLPKTKELPISLESSDTGPLCNASKPDNATNFWNWGYQHRQQCHALSHSENNRRRAAEGLTAMPLKKCRTRRWGSDHCECFSRKYRLHSRLRGWMPKGLYYCGTCERFTRRKRGHKGRCFHGGSKPRSYEGNYWTHRRGRGGFGYEMWKKWFNNAAMNSLEQRLKNENSRAGKAVERYSLRTIAAKEVDTKEVRNNHSRFWG